MSETRFPRIGKRRALKSLTFIMYGFRTLKAGTVLYHGTDAEFEEAFDALDGPCWVTDSIEVATHFAQSSGWGGEPRVIAYVLLEDVKLPCIESHSELRVLAEEHDLDLSGREGMRESLEVSECPGWIIPNNYPEGADIFLKHTNVLRYVETMAIKKVPKPTVSPTR